MVDQEHKQPDPENSSGATRADTGPEMEDRDPVIEEVFRDLPKVHVSDEFLPRVMSTVYTHHVRTQIRFGQVMAISVLLLGLTSVFLLWDVMTYQHERGLEYFGQAFTEKLNLLTQQMTGSFSDVTGILAASWQWITGAGSLIFTQTHFVMLAILVLCLALIAFGIKKYLESLHQTPR